MSTEQKIEFFVVCFTIGFMVATFLNHDWK